MDANDPGQLDAAAIGGGKGPIDDGAYLAQVERRLLQSRGPGYLHLLTGLRGSGKTRMAREILGRLTRDGEQTRYLSLEEPEFRWVRNGCDFFLALRKMFEHLEGPVFLIMDEPTAIPYMSAAIGSLVTDGRFEVLVVSSTASVLSGEERSYFGDRFNEVELLPVKGSRRYSLSERLVKDVLKEPGVPDIHILERVIECLAETVGREHTQRELAEFAEWDRAISKNTPARCVAALVNTRVIRAMSKYNLFARERSPKSGWKYCFTDPGLRRENFGRLSAAAESFEATAVGLARLGDEVCWTDDAPGVVDFVTLRGDAIAGCWRATAEGPVAAEEANSLFRQQF